VTGVIAKVEARLQGRRGPRVAQPYYDLAKLFRKEALAPEQASWFFLAAPVIAVTAYLTIPVLTSYPLPLGYMGDILGGGFLLSLASFVVAMAALETGTDLPYALAALSAALKVVAVPLVMRRLLGRTVPANGDETPGVYLIYCATRAAAHYGDILLPPTSTGWRSRPGETLLPR
jgi:formate hydrogenlyase subunit 4